MKTVTTTDVYGKQYKTTADQLGFSVHVYGIAVDNGKVLVLPQFDGYDWPGGGMELGETIEEALKREYFEETGLKVELIKFLKIYDCFFHHLYKNQDSQAILLFYLVKVVGGELSTDGFSEYEKDYAEQARWVSIEELKQMHHACSIDIADELIKLIEEP